MSTFFDIPLFFLFVEAKSHTRTQHCTQHSYYSYLYLFFHDRIPHLRTVIIATQENLAGVLRFDDVMEMGKGKQHEVEEIERELDFDDPINIQYTSVSMCKSKVYHHIGSYFNSFVKSLDGYDIW